MIRNDRRRLLGEFVRAHRERLLPPATEGRRRTPGLRREELAARAGISTTWCAWIEQGRQVQASSDALSRLAAALGLTHAERAYLFELAGQIDPVARARTEFEQVPPSLAEAVRSLDHPAYGLDRLWNVCCYNSRTDGLFQGWLGRASDHNLLRFVFLDPAARELIPNWEERARRLLAEFRADFVHNLHDDSVHALIAGMSAESALFADAWHTQDVQHREGGHRSFFDLNGGTLNFVQHTFKLAERPDYKLVMLVPEKT